MCDSGRPVGTEPDDLQRLGIDYRNRIPEFGRDVEQAVFGTEHRTVRPHSVTEVNIPDYLARGDIDNNQIAAVAARLSDTRVAVDWHERGTAIWRCDHFMARISAFRNCGNLLSGLGIDDAESAIPFVGNKQETARDAARRGSPRGSQQDKHNRRSTGNKS